MGDGPLTRPAVFLDRDGVLNEPVVRDGRPHPPQTVDELVVDADAQVALLALKARGYQLLVVTNQPDVARGTQTREAVEAIHASLQSRLPIDAFLVCYHDDSHNCDCRKPRSGLIFAGSREFDIDLRRSFMIGDRWRDVEAGKSAGLQVIMIDRGYDEQVSAIKPDAVVHSLREAAALVVEETSLVQ